MWQTDFELLSLDHARIMPRAPPRTAKLYWIEEGRDEREPRAGKAALALAVHRLRNKPFVVLLIEKA